MKKFGIVLGILMMSDPLWGQSVMAVKTIRAQTVLTAADVALSESHVPGAFSSVDAIIGQEAKVMLFPGRAIHPSDIGPAAIIERNHVVPLRFSRAGLTITAEARAMDRASVGESLRVMNLSSRTTVFGVVQSDGSVVVGGLP